MCQCECLTIVPVCRGCDIMVGGASADLAFEGRDKVVGGVPPSSWLASDISIDRMSIVCLGVGYVNVG